MLEWVRKHFHKKTIAQMDTINVKELKKIITERNW